MAGFNADLELGRIARESRPIQSKKLMWGIKGIYSSARVADCRSANQVGWTRKNGIGSKLRDRDRGRSPFVDCMPATAIEALCCGVLRTTVRTDGARFERIEGLAALNALPIRSNWRSSFARRTGKSRASWKSCHAQQRLGVLEPSPAVHCHVEGDAPNHRSCLQTASPMNATAPSRPKMAAVIRLRARPSTNQSRDRKIWPPSKG
jgi:hypothetical protein